MADPRAKRRLSRLALAAVFAMAAGAAVWWVQATGWRLPDRWNPFSPLSIAEEPGWFTPYKLARLGADPAQCLAVLATGSFRYEPLPDRETAPGCGYRNAVRIARTSVEPGAPFTLACPAAVALARWERHVVQPAAERHFGQPVLRFDHLGSYACRNVYGREAAPRSEHATADAIDIAGFVLRDGRRIAVVRDWRREGGGDAAAFLREARDGACGLFSAVLGPDYNAEHANHLHLDRGRYRVCR